MTVEQQGAVVLPAMPPECTADGVGLLSAVKFRAGQIELESLWHPRTRGVPSFQYIDQT